MADPYAWHVSAALRGSGRRRYGDARDFVFHVQRYVRPDEAERYTGMIAPATFHGEADAQRLADDLNAGLKPVVARLTYL